MDIEDFRRSDAPTDLEADLCLVGSGLAAWAIAAELRGSGLSILVLESGGVAPDDHAASLNATRDLGVKLFNGRTRAFGGTSLVWNGRCKALDAIDYEARPWVKQSGWPFGAAEVAPFVARASEHLRAWPVFQPDGSPWEPVPPVPRPQVDPSRLSTSSWENPPVVNAGERLRTDGGDAVRVLVNATVTHVNTDGNGRQCGSVEIADPSGRRGLVRARAVVLCAGGIENARILLYSNRTVPAGVGNARDVVGRYFMDHPRDFELLARFAPRDATAFRRAFGPYVVDGPRGRTELCYGFSLSADYQRREKLLNCAAWPYEVRVEDDPVDALRRLVRRRSVTPGRDARLLARNAPFVADVVRRRALHVARSRLGRADPIGRGAERPYRVERIGFLVSSEQTPDRDSRIRLGARRDRLGLPTTEIDWRIGPQERASQAALARLIAVECGRVGLPPVRVADWVRSGRYEDANFADGCHPIGATRMSTDPATGVVDAECRVHGVDGLFVAGSSVFPTGGHANPTLMIVSLAVRLATHLRGQLAATGATTRHRAADTAVAA